MGRFGWGRFAKAVHVQAQSASLHVTHVGFIAEYRGRWPDVAWRQRTNPPA